MSNLDKTVTSISLLTLIFWLYVGVCWVINLIQFFGCDFDSPWKEEIIKAIGILVVPASGITVWIN